MFGPKCVTDYAYQNRFSIVVNLFSVTRGLHFIDPYWMLLRLLLNGDKAEKHQRDHARVPELVLLVGRNKEEIALIELLLTNLFFYSSCSLQDGSAIQSAIVSRQVR